MKEFNLNSTIECFQKKRNKTYKKDKLKCPTWLLGKEDLLSGLYSNQEEIFKNGEIHLGCVVQANSILFKLRPFINCPANFIYTKDPFYLEHPEELYRLANYLYSIKGQNIPDKKVQIFADILYNELQRVFALKLPSYLTGNREVYFTTVIVHRKHIPKMRLLNTFYPLIICKKVTPEAIILPKWYWKN